MFCMLKSLGVISRGLPSKFGGSEASQKRLSGFESNLLLKTCRGFYFWTFFIKSSGQNSQLESQLSFKELTFKSELSFRKLFSRDGFEVGES